MERLRFENAEVSRFLHQGVIKETVTTVQFKEHKSVNQFFRANLIQYYQYAREQRMQNCRDCSYERTSKALVKVDP